jgi:hypothetical protein
MTESAARSRQIHMVSPWQILSTTEEKAAQALRMARDNTDPELIKNLRAFAAECNAIADVIDGRALEEDLADE